MTLTKIASLILVCVLGLLPAGCSSFSPVYRVQSAASTLAFNFATPTNRLEQIVYSELAFAFPNVPDPQAPTLKVAAGAAAPKGALPNALSVGRIMVTRVAATVTIGDGPDAISITRFTEAQHQTGSLVLTDQAATTDAAETAARSTAQALVTAILAELAR